MLTREMMGLAALWILWLNAALVLAVALRQLGNLLELRRRFDAAAARGELVTGLLQGSGVFAVRRIAQTGRAITARGPDRILFTDGAQSFEVLGGVVQTDAGDIEVAASPPVLSEVWLDAQRMERGVACTSESEFAAAWKSANTSRGYSRQVELEVRGGERVWVLGARQGARLSAQGDTPLLVSTVDPRAFCAARVRLVVAFLAGATVALVGVTGLALWPPHFGALSTVGGALCLAYFLGVPPIGTAVRDAVMTPARRRVGALWQRPHGEVASSHSLTG